MAISPDGRTAVDPPATMRPCCGTSLSFPTICRGSSAGSTSEPVWPSTNEGQVKSLERLGLAGATRSARLAGRGPRGGGAAVAARPHPLRPRTHRPGQGLGGAEAAGPRPRPPSPRPSPRGRSMRPSGSSAPVLHVPLPAREGRRGLRPVIRPRQPRPEAASTRSWPANPCSGASSRSRPVPPRPSGRSTASCGCRNRAGTRRPSTSRGSLSFCRRVAAGTVRAVERALDLARWDRAYARLLELRPDDGQLWCVRGRYYALRDQWDLAAADFARGITSAPPDSEEWFEHACLRLIVGDNEGYRASVREIAAPRGSDRKIPSRRSSWPAPRA